MALGIIIAIGEALRGIYNGIKAASELVLSLLGSLLSFVIGLLQSAIQASPPIMKLWIFLLLLVIVLNPVVSIILNIGYVCDNGELRQPIDFTTGFASLIEATYEGVTNSTTSLDGYVANRTVAVGGVPDEQDITRIECLGDRPHLTFIGIDPFSYKTWLIILMLGGLIKLYLKFHG